MAEDNQHFMGESHDRFLLAATTGDAVIEGGEILVFGASNRPGHLSQDRSQVGLTRGGRPAQALAATLFVAWADAREGVPGACPKGNGASRCRSRPRWPPRQWLECRSRSGPA